jgi:hypothetical protein
VSIDGISAKFINGLCALVRINKMLTIGAKTVEN